MASVLCSPLTACSLVMLYFPFTLEQVAADGAGCLRSKPVGTDGGRWDW